MRLFPGLVCRPAIAARTRPGAHREPEEDALGDPREHLAQPRVFVHRDYHSRNLMVSEPCPGILDFQDAVYGPITYDLVSLLRDAYVAGRRSASSTGRSGTGRRRGTRACRSLRISRTFIAISSGWGSSGS